MTGRSFVARLIGAFRGPLAIYLGASILARVGSFVLIPLYTRKLTEAEYGEYALAQTIVNILPIFLTLGIFIAIPRYFYDGTKEESHAKAASVARWLLVLTAIGGVV